MGKTVVQSRIDSKLKEKAVQLFGHLGLTLSAAIRLFIYQSVAEKRIPFTVNVPNAMTRIALKEATQTKHLKKTSLKQLKKTWNETRDK